MSTQVKIIILCCIGLYFLLLIMISRAVSGKSTDEAFFTGDRKSPWILVSIGMIGASLSGVTFISVPGTVSTQGMTYIQIALGNMLGYLFIAQFLVPFFYRQKSISIYDFLKDRLGVFTQKTASGFFVIAKLLGASFRLFIVCKVISMALLPNIKFSVILFAAITLFLTYLYTRTAGIKAIVFTDVLQTVFMIAAIVLTFAIIFMKMDCSLIDMLQNIKVDKSLSVFVTDPSNSNFFLKDILSGFVLAIAANGLDQDMMQKNLTCKNTRESQKNIRVFSVMNISVILLFLFLGYTMVYYAGTVGCTAQGDSLYPELAFHYLGLPAAIVLVIGMTAACFSSVDSALTAMTTSICLDFLNIDTAAMTAQDKKKKFITHFTLAAMMVIVIACFSNQSDSVVNLVFKTAGYTYGPIIGIFAYAIFLKKKTFDTMVPLIALFSVVFCALLDIFGPTLIGYQPGFELSIINGTVTFVLMYIFGIFKRRHIPPAL